MGKLVERKIKIGDLFEFLSSRENKIENSNNETTVYLNDLVQLQDPHGTWLNSPAMIKKQTDLRQLKFSNDITLNCSSEHKLCVNVDTKECIFAKDITIGMQIPLSESLGFVECLENTLVSDFASVFDLQVDSPDHLYKTANGLVHHNTLIAKTIAKMLDVPFAIADATTLTEAGLKIAHFIRENIEKITLIAGNSFGTISSQAYRVGMKVQRLVRMDVGPSGSKWVTTL